MGNLALTGKAFDEIEAIKKGVGDLVIRMSALKVKTAEDYQAAISVGKEGKDSIKALEKEKDEIISEPDRYVKKVKETVKAIIAPIESAMDELRERCRAYDRAEEAKRQKAISDLAEKQRKAEQAIAEANTEQEQEKAVAKVEKIEAKIEIKVAEKTDNTVRVRKFEVVDVNALPREYLIPDEKKIRRSIGGVDDPIPTIAGLKIWNENQVKFG